MSVCLFVCLCVLVWLGVCWFDVLCVFVGVCVCVLVRSGRLSCMIAGFVVCGLQTDHFEARLATFRLGWPPKSFNFSKTFGGGGKPPPQATTTREEEGPHRR